MHGFESITPVPNPSCMVHGTWSLEHDAMLLLRYTVPTHSTKHCRQNKHACEPASGMGFVTNKGNSCLAAAT